MKHLTLSLACAALPVLACSNLKDIDGPVGPSVTVIPATLEPLDLAALGGATILFSRQPVDGSGSTHFVVEGASGRVTRPEWYALSSGHTLSPSGQFVAYGKHMGFSSPSAYDIHVSSVDGSNERRITTINGNWESEPAWYPDGANLAFYIPAYNQAGTAEAPGFALYSIGAFAGGPPRSVIAAGAWQQPGGPGPCPLATYLEFSTVAVSVLGEVAFACGDGSVFAFNGGQAPMSGRLVHAPSSQERTGQRVYAMSWSPNGERLAVLANHVRNGGVTEVAVLIVNVQTGSIATLATLPKGLWGEWALTRGYSMCWLGAANAILFTALDGELRSHVYLVSAAGGPLRQFTTKANVSDTDLSCTL